MLFKLLLARREYRIMKNVCVFASSSNNLASVYYQQASELGELLGQNGYNIVYGGSRLGMMFACASSVKENGGKIYGVMPKKLVDFGVANPDDCDVFIKTDGMREVFIDNIDKNITLWRTPNKTRLDCEDKNIACPFFSFRYPIYDITAQIDGEEKLVSRMYGIAYSTSTLIRFLTGMVKTSRIVYHISKNENNIIILKEKQ